MQIFYLAVAGWHVLVRVLLTLSSWHISENILDYIFIAMNAVRHTKSADPVPYKHLSTGCGMLVGHCKHLSPFSKTALNWENAVLGLSSSFTCIYQYPDAKSRQENHWPPPSASKTSSVTVLHLSMYTNSVCSNQCTYSNIHHVSLQPDCSRGSVTLQLYHSLAARPAVDLWSPSGVEVCDEEYA